MTIYGHPTFCIFHFYHNWSSKGGRKENVVKIGFVTYFLTGQSSVWEFLEWAAINLVIFSRSSINNVIAYHHVDFAFFVSSDFCWFLYLFWIFDFIEKIHVKLAEVSFKGRVRIHLIYWLCNVFLGEDGASNLRTSFTRRCKNLPQESKISSCRL